MTSTTATSQLSEFLVSQGAETAPADGSVLHFGAPASELMAFSGPAVVIDRTSGSRVSMTGPDALDLLHRLTTNELLDLAKGRSRFTLLTSERGRTIDLLSVARINDTKLLLLSEAIDARPTVNWIDRFTIVEDSETVDISGETAQVTVIGTEVFDRCSDALGVQLETGACTSTEFDTSESTLVCSLWGDLQRVDVVVPESGSVAAWQAVAAAGAQPAGELAYEAARIGLGIPAAGREIDEHSNPLEVGLRSLVSFSKGCYVGQEVVARLDTYDKVQRVLARLQSGTALKAGAQLVDGSRKAGMVTSASGLSPDGVFGALALVRTEFRDDGRTLSANGVEATVKQVASTEPYA